jgi:hypothetical protein
MTSDVSVSRPPRLSCGWVRLLVHVWAISVLSLAAACSVDDVPNAQRDAPAGPGAIDTSPSGSGGAIPNLPEPPTTDGGICPLLVCSTGTTQNCGDLVDVCGQTLRCGACSADKQCKNNVCVGTECLAGCNIAGGSYCGLIGDGCGGTLDCGTACPLAGWTCGADHICKGDSSVCQADTCVAASGDQYCGTIGDGCGNTLDCGNPCPTGWNCVNNLCVGLPGA